MCSKLIIFVNMFCFLSSSQSYYVVLFFHFFFSFSFYHFIVTYYYYSEPNATSIAESLKHTVYLTEGKIAADINFIVNRMITLRYIALQVYENDGLCFLYSLLKIVKLHVAQ